MPKKLVLCLDGTSNQYKKDNTNVVKLLALLDKRAPDQLVYYLPGVGTRAAPGRYGRLSERILRTLDLAFAILLKYYVQDAYRFIMRYYEEGDQIYLFGFSRGAYTARVVAAMLDKVGVLGKGNEELIPYAWDIYREPRNIELARRFRATFSRKVRIRFLGVWDTVSSVRWALKPVSLPGTHSNSSVDIVRHAVALDERRAYFRQNLWDSTPPVGQDVLEVWFPGVHCDVGGGYAEAECGLSKIALAWMVQQVALELTFFAPAVARMIPPQSSATFAAPDPVAPIHESLRGLWKIVEWLPKRIRDPERNFATRWILPRGAPRFVNAAVHLDPSVAARRAAGVGYQPKNLP